jgi:electron transfer flavoprotein beta subunit
MKILVAVKRVVSSSVKVRVKRDETGVETQNVKMAINDFDEIAVEQAVQLKEAGYADEILVTSIGPSANQDTIRNALAIGADRGLLIEQDGEIESLTVAKLLQKVIDQEKPDLVLMGKQAIDNDCNQAPQMLAGLLGWAQGTFISKLTMQEQAVAIARETDEGLHHLKLKLPAVLSVDLRLAQPRYPSMTNIMQAKRKTIDKALPCDYGIDPTPRVRSLKVSEPPPRPPGQMVASVAELVDKLHNEAKLI